MEVRWEAQEIRTSRRNKNNELNFMKLVCSKEGKYLSPIAREWKAQPSQKTQCPAGITIAMKEGRWQVRTVINEHNHDTCPNNSNRIHGNRILNMHAKHTLNMNHDAGVHINKSFISLVNDAGGFENVAMGQESAWHKLSRHKFLKNYKKISH
ncbi:protein FAR-RED IMPAIRED RESPONSE 1-like [Vigna radiata var. radiata]|uniref:Protein FAR-RED IMPAIRED RESPONSE 1-like n=1 Tax=Vigna radiata var. radiata TaxID=3916 RepID=A0A1S3UZJ8_VIGRR|nr:protein FAR-RED IMPAIRED RESPONSE 1-like [Vigna radiata var. radiata]